LLPEACAFLRFQAALCTFFLGEFEKRYAKIKKMLIFLKKGIEKMR
jgi:hypothetical protein